MMFFFHVLMIYMCFENIFEKNRPPSQMTFFYIGLRIFGEKVAKFEKDEFLALNQL